MKKLFILSLLFSAIACSNPEDKATGNTDSSSSSFNSDENKVLNTKPGATDPNSQSNAATSDTSASPATSTKNANSTTTGTNRPYGNGRDSGRK